MSYQSSGLNPACIVFLIQPILNVQIPEWMNEWMNEWMTAPEPWLSYFFACRIQCAIKWNSFIKPNFPRNILKLKRPSFVSEHATITHFKLCSVFKFVFCSSSAENYLLKVNSGNPRTIYEILSKLRINTPKRRHWHCSSVSFVKFGQISLIVVVLLLVLNKYIPAGLFTKKGRR